MRYQIRGALAAGLDPHNPTGNAGPDAPVARREPEAAMPADLNLAG